MFIIYFIKYKQVRKKNVSYLFKASSKSNVSVYCIKSNYL